MVSIRFEPSSHLVQKSRQLDRYANGNRNNIKNAIVHAVSRVYTLKADQVSSSSLGHLNIVGHLHVMSLACQTISSPSSRQTSQTVSSQSSVIDRFNANISYS